MLASWQLDKVGEENHASKPIINEGNPISVTLSKQANQPVRSVFRLVVCNRLPDSLLAPPLGRSGVGNSAGPNFEPGAAVEATCAINLVALVVGADRVLGAATGLEDAALKEGGDHVLGDGGVLLIDRSGSGASGSQAKGKGNSEGSELHFYDGLERWFEAGFVVLELA